MTEDKPPEGTVYWLTLVITDDELAERLDCSVDEIRSQDYIGAIRDFGEVVKIEEVEA